MQTANECTAKKSAFRGCHTLPIGRIFLSSIQFVLFYSPSAESVSARLALHLSSIFATAEDRSLPFCVAVR